MIAGKRRVLGALVFTSIVALTGCARGCTSSRPPIHLNPSMDDQPKVTPQTASTFFYDGQSMRQPVPGTIADRRAERRRGLLHRQGRGRAVRRDDPAFRGRGAARARASALQDLLPAVPRRSRRRPGHPVPARQRPDRHLSPGKDPQIPGRTDLRRHNERGRADARLSLADPACRPVGDHRPRARTPARSAGPCRERACRGDHSGGHARLRDSSAGPAGGQPVMEAAG